MGAAHAVMGTYRDEVVMLRARRAAGSASLEINVRLVRSMLMECDNLCM